MGLGATEVVDTPVPSTVSWRGKVLLLLGPFKIRNKDLLLLSTYSAGAKMLREFCSVDNCQRLVHIGSYRCSQYLSQTPTLSQGTRERRSTAPTTPPLAISNRSVN